MKGALALFGFALIIVLCVQETYGETLEFDPLKRNLIVAEGEASLSVPINEFRISFTFDIEKGSFDEARIESKRISERIGQVLKELNIPRSEVVEGWNLIKESKISFGSKGRKLSNIITITVEDIPKGKLHEFLGKIIDNVLAIDRSIVLDDIEIDITDAIDRAKKQEALSKAVEALESNAMKIAQSLGRKISSPKRVFVSSRESLEKIGKSESYDYSYSFTQEYAKPVFRKGFKVKGQIVDHIYITANVIGIYEIE